ncbi:MAG: ATP-binding cassette domain-containing protein [Mariniblastus sp.]|jgi:ABC-2 type transport system ATP-binding protein|nr:ATP-binding cassette domain-containing protein [Mariniblastus sp.]
MTKDKEPTPGQVGDGELMIEAVGLCKFYGPFAAVNDVTFSVPRRQVCAFLGPNGAGKSTTMKLLTGFLAPTKGSIAIAGHDMQENRIKGSEHIGYLPENGPLYEEMTPRSALSYLGRARGLSVAAKRDRMNFVAEKCDLSEVWNKPISKLSRGFRQRVGMAQALLHDPDVLILDEPTSGLDPNQLVGIRNLIRELGESKTVLLSTHILQEVEFLCSRVVLIDQGRLVFDELIGEMGARDAMEEKFHQLTGFQPQTVSAAK